MMLNIKDAKKRYAYDDSYIQLYAKRYDVKYTLREDGSYKKKNYY